MPTDLTATLRDIATTVVLECQTCLCAILPGEAQVWRGETLCPACALDAVAPIAVEGLSVYDFAGRDDLATKIRAAEVLVSCAAMFKASVDVAARRAR